MSILIELLLITIMASVASALPGNFLVLRGQSLTTFALSHSILFGIIIIYLITGSLSSPVLIIGASLSGMFIVWLVEYLSRMNYVSNDAALGIVYTFIFSVSIILASNADSLILNPKSIITGNIALVAFDRLIVSGNDLGPKQIWISLVVLLLNIGYISLFYKELKLTSFDGEYAKIMGINTAFINLSFMFLVSITVVSTYQVAGVILVVAIMIIPPASAYLLTSTLRGMILSSVMIAVLTSVTGFGIAWILGSVEIASVIGIVNGLVFIVILTTRGGDSGRESRE